MDDLMQEPAAWITAHGEGFRMRFSPPTNDMPLGWDALYTEDQLREYAKKAVEAERAKRQPLTLWTEAQHERAYRNSPELHKDVKSLAAFKRVAKEIAAMYGIIALD